MHSREWKAATDSEYQSLIENDTWELVELPADRTAIGCKWVFKTKCGSDSTVDRYKGQLVAKGYAQRFGVDYDETFSPVVRFSSIRAPLAFAVENDMLVHQMDVVTAFLNGTLEEEIYMQQPEGYIQPGSDHLVCKLINFKRNEADPFVFVRMESGNPTIVAVYVDDLIVLTKALERMNGTKKSLAEQFKMKDLGEIHYCLGINIQRNEDKKYFIMHQKQYILAVVEKYGLSEVNTVATPADVNVQLKKDDGISKVVDPTNYQSMVGSLLYASVATRPDITHAVGAVSKYCSKPNETHLTAVKCILRYLKGTAEFCL